MYNFDPYNVLLVIATNIPVLLMTASVVQGHVSPPYLGQAGVLGHGVERHVLLLLEHAEHVMQHTHLSQRAAQVITHRVPRPQRRLELHRTCY